MSTHRSSDREPTDDEANDRRGKSIKVPGRRALVWACSVAVFVAVAAGLLIRGGSKEQHEWRRLHALLADTADIRQAVQRRKAEIESDDPELKRIDVLLDANRRDHAKGKMEGQDQKLLDQWRRGKAKEMDDLVLEIATLNPIDDEPAYRALEVRRDWVRKELDEDGGEWLGFSGEGTKVATDLHIRHSARLEVLRLGAMRNDAEIVGLYKKAREVSIMIQSILKEHPEWREWR